MVSTTSTLKTYEDFLKSPDDGQRYELFDGEIFVSPTPSQRHQWASQLLNRRLDRYVESHGLGRVYVAPLDVRLDHDVVLEPDIFFIRSGSSADDVTTTWIEGPPSLVVEILSKSTAARDLQRKRALYEQFSIEEYWIVDTSKPAITALRSIDGRYEPITQSSGHFTSQAVPGLEIDIAEIFSGMF